jgi:hypothetical protein
MATNRPNSLTTYAPYVCAALLLSLLFVGGVSARRPFGTNDYRARVRAALDAIPFKIGPAVGVEVEPVPAVMKLLSANKIIERHYVDPATGLGFSVLVVHCGDVRDIIGHFPPQCYPAHGWKIQGSADTPIVVNGEHGAAVRYDFTREEELFQTRMSVIDFFVIPEEGPTIFRDMAAVEKASRSSQTGGLGVAQIQILLPDGAPDQWKETVINDTLAAMGPALKTISQGIQK